MNWFKFAAGAAIVGLLLWIGAIALSWKHDSEQLAKVELERDQARTDLVLKDQQFTDVQEASFGYQEEIRALRDARRPVPAVRLCNVPRVPDRRELPVPEPRPDGAGPGTGTVPPGPRGDPGEGPGPDIGSDLAELADRADRLSARVRGLQAYARGCSGAVQNGNGDSGILR